MWSEKYPSTRPLKFVPTRFPELVFNPTGVGAPQSAQIDASAFLPPEARYALFIVSFFVDTLVVADLLEVYHDICRDDWNAFGSMVLYKEANHSTWTNVYPYQQFIVPLVDRRYRYRIGGTFNGNRVSVEHWLVGWFT